MLWAFCASPSPSYSSSSSRSLPASLSSACLPKPSRACTPTRAQSVASSASPSPSSLPISSPPKRRRRRRRKVPPTTSSLQLLLLLPLLLQLFSAVPRAEGVAEVAPYNVQPVAPIPIVKQLTLRMIKHPQQPAVIRNPAVQEAFWAAGFGSFDEMKRVYGDVPIVLGEESWVWDDSEQGRQHDFSQNKVISMREYIESLQANNGSAKRLSAIGGVDFFRKHFEVSKSLVEALHLTVPRLFRTPHAPGPYDGNWSWAWQEWSDLMMWAGDENFLYTIHQDYVTGAILYHIDGPKHVSLYPPEQHHLLYLHSDDSDVYEANTMVPLEVQKGERPVPDHFQKFAHAKPLQVELQPGDAVYLPCEWAHQVWYDGPALSVSFNFGSTSPEGCSDLITGAVDHVMEKEEVDRVATAEWGPEWTEEPPPPRRAEEAVERQEL